MREVFTRSFPRISVFGGISAEEIDEYRNVFAILRRGVFWSPLDNDVFVESKC